MKTEVLFSSVQKRKKYEPLTTEGLKTLESLMASERKLRRKNSLRKSQRKVSRQVSSFAKDEELEKILQDIEVANKYNPSSKNAKKRPSVGDDDDGLPPDEELDKFFVDVEKRNAELQELLRAVESARDAESEGQLSRITSAEERGSTESLVEELMKELDSVDCEKNSSNGTIEMQKSSNKVSKKMANCKIKASASEQELDQMLAELLEL